VRLLVLSLLFQCDTISQKPYSKALFSTRSHGFGTDRLSCRKGAAGECYRCECDVRVPGIEVEDNRLPYRIGGGTEARPTGHAEVEVLLVAPKFGFRNAQCLSRAAPCQGLNAQAFDLRWYAPVCRTFPHLTGPERDLKDIFDVSSSICLTQRSAKT
jgi:hypothetical protein